MLLIYQNISFFTPDACANGHFSHIKLLPNVFILFLPDACAIGNECPSPFESKFLSGVHRWALRLFISAPDWGQSNSLSRKLPSNFFLNNLIPPTIFMWPEVHRAGIRNQGYIRLCHDIDWLQLRHKTCNKALLCCKKVFVFYGSWREVGA